MNNDNRFEINRAVDLENLGKMIEGAIDCHENSDYDGVRDMLLELHHQIFPNARRMLTREEEKAYYAELHRQEENSTCRALDRTVTLEEVGQLVQQTAEKLFEGDWNEATEQFIELHDRLFPEGFQPAPAEEVAVLEPAPPADYLILQDDDLINPNRSEAETLELLRDVQNQILDGEREPEDFLEALELMYRISRQYTAASEQAAQRAEQAEARLVHLMQQNQHLLGVLNLISQGTDHCTPQYHN